MGYTFSTMNEIDTQPKVEIELSHSLLYAINFDSQPWNGKDNSKRKAINGNKKNEIFMTFEALCTSSAQRLRVLVVK